MANMSYCRFENTYNDLMECYESLSNDETLSESEKKYKEKLIALCSEIHYDFSESEDEDEE